MKIVNNMIFFCNCFDKGINTLKDLNPIWISSVWKPIFLSDYRVINAIPQEYKKAMRHTNVQQGHATQTRQTLKVLTTKAIFKGFVKYIFEEPTTKQRLIHGSYNLEKWLCPRVPVHKSRYK